MSKPVFDAVDTALRFPEMEAKILAFWKAKDIFHKSLKQREGRPTWVFYEGPPTANGKPHPGHVLTRVVKDLFPRYKTMCGYSVPRKAGWDTHGLPVEIEVEKDLKISGKEQILDYGVEKFVRKCMDSVFRYTADWEKLTERIGFWIDLPDAYVTYHKAYVESVWWSLQQLHGKGLLYRGHKIVPYCPRCGTALSSHEVGLGYKEVEDPSIFVTFKSAEDESVSFLAWTTTPWTLPSNAGLAVKADTEYAHVRVGKDENAETLIMATALVKQAMGKVPHEIVKTEPGGALVGRRYKPLFDWWQGKDAEKSKAWKVCAADFVDLTTGSGIVHMAPAFGADDYALGQKEGLPMIQLVDAAGKFVAGCGDFTGRFVKDADKDIIKDLRDRKLLLKRENYKHDYPFCWRCDSPLLYYARAGWFIRTTQEIGRVIQNNQAINWHPPHIQEGRFGKFLESNIDWALSRERFWGTPLPVWCCEGCGKEEAIGKFDELKEKKNPRGLDAFDKAKAKDPSLNEHLRVHKPWIDEAVYDCAACGKTMRRVTEVIDCWYDSGAMPFAQWGYPHAPNALEKFEKAFPADFISEAIDQTRGWFYSLLAESTLLFEHMGLPHPYKTCVVLGHVCDEKGKKLSKSNPEHRSAKYDPNAILDEEGADALRWFFYAGNAPWNNSRFSRGTVRETQKEFLVKLYNVFSFFTIYANIDGFDPKTATFEDDGDEAADFARFHRGGRAPSERAEMDRWVLGELHQTVNAVRAKLDGYDIYGAAQALNAFAESLSNWYVQRSRDRYWRSWKTENRTDALDLDKLDAYWTLYECLATTTRLMAPFVPFLAESMWQTLARGPLGEKVPESVHLADYPTADPAVIDGDLARDMALVREVVSLGRNVRAAQKIKTRTPLSRLVLVLAEPARTEVLRSHEDILKDALNVKTVEFAAQADQYVTYSLKPNFPKIGAKYRELVPEIKKALAGANAAHLKNKFANDGMCSISAGGKQVDLSADEVEVAIEAKEGFAAAGGRLAVVVLDTKLTPELLDEGFAREMVNRVNGLRGKLNLKYEQRIKLAVKGTEKLETIARKHGEYICGETLAVELQVGAIPTGWKEAEGGVDVEGEAGQIALTEA